MKALLAIWFLIFSVNVSANKFFTLRCETLDLSYLNKFEMIGSIELDDQQSSFKSVGKLISYFEDPGNDIAGFVKKFELEGSVTMHVAGILFQNEVIQLQAVKRNDDIVYINILGNYKAPISSTIRFANGKEYRARCDLF